MKKQIILILLIVIASFSLRADTFTIQMSTLQGSPLRNSGWAIIDTLGNVLTSYFGMFDDSSTSQSTQITLSGGPYIFEGRNCTSNLEPIYDWVLFDVLGSSPHIYMSVPFPNGPYLSEIFWASVPNPVKFGNLEVIQNTNFDYLHFNTLTESSCEKFIVQKGDGQNKFVDMAEIKSKSIQGNSNIELSYEYRNYDINNGEVFYRIKQLDFDGKSTLSKIVYLNRKAKENFFNVYPNPTNNELNFDFENTNSSLLDVCIYYYTGNLKAKIYSGIPINKLSTNLKDLSSGIYFLRVAIDNELVYTKLIVKE